MVNEKGEVLKGSIITQFMYEYRDKTAGLRQARDALSTINRVGVNAVSFTLNTVFFDNPQYLSELLTMLQEAQALHLSTILSIHSDGWSENVSWGSLPKQLVTVDSNLKVKWMSLLKNPTYGRDLIRNTNAYILLQEAGPVYQDNQLIVRDLDWRRDMPYYIETTKAIRELTGFDTPCSLSGGFWGRRYGDLLQMGQAPLPNLLLNIDPYFETNKNPRGEEALGQISQMRALGYTPFIGELGWMDVKTGDTIDDVKRRLEIAQRDGLAYFFWEMHKWKDLQDLFISHNPK